MDIHKCFLENHNKTRYHKYHYFLLTGILGFGKGSIFDDVISINPTTDKKNTINTKEYCRIKRRMAILKIPYALREQFQNAKKTKAIEEPIHRELVILIIYVVKLKTS